MSTQPPPPPPGDHGDPGDPGTPGDPYWPPAPPTGRDPYDPIVAYDFTTWLNRVTGVFSRSWRSIGLIMLVGAVVPSLIVGTTYTAIGPVDADMRNTDVTEYYGEVFAGGVSSLLAWVIASVLGAAAVIAALRTAVREASPGASVPFKEAMAYGFRRCVPLWGWTVLSSLAIMVGFILCVLPGIYLSIALAFLAPAFVFDGGNPFMRSVRLTNSAFWRTVGRLLVAVLAALVYGCVIGIPVGIIEAGVLGVSPGFMEFLIVAIIEAVRAVLMLPVAIGAVAVILVTYAEIRGAKEGLTTGALVAEAEVTSSG